MAATGYLRRVATGALEPILFFNDVAFARAAEASGISHFLVDWESRDKAARQLGFDTQISAHGVSDLRSLRKAVQGTVCCRINPFGGSTRNEVDCAIDAGASVLFLPMVTTPAQVEAFIGYVGGRAQSAILVETNEACACARELASFPLSLVYVGLNDLAIARGKRNIFTSLVDGTVDTLRETFAAHSFGVAGVTRLDAGAPVPFSLLLAALERLDCRFSFARRSFFSDMAGRDMAKELLQISQAWQALASRTADERAASQAALSSLVTSLE